MDKTNKEYQQLGNALRRAVRDDPADRFEIEIGDEKDVSKFQPQIKLKNWDNEVNASFRLLDDEPKRLVTENGRVKLVGAKKEIHFYNKQGKPFAIGSSQTPRYIKLGEKSPHFLGASFVLPKLIIPEAPRILSFSFDRKSLILTGGFYTWDKYLYPDKIPSDVTKGRGYTSVEVGAFYCDQGTSLIQANAKNHIKQEDIYNIVSRVLGKYGVSTEGRGNDLLFVKDGEKTKFCGIFWDTNLTSFFINFRTDTSYIKDAFRRDGASTTGSKFSSLNEVIPNLTSSVQNEIVDKIAHHLANLLDITVVEGVPTSAEQAVFDKYETLLSGEVWIEDAIADWYRSSDRIDGFEFDVVLKEKPDSNVLTFSIETKGLDFFYQPRLTKEERNSGHHRPEDVVGSYAVYHATKKDNYSEMGGKDYKSGKAFHVFRPRIVDSVGKEVWGELNIDVVARTQTIIIPQDFLDNAVYPVRQAAGAIFGYYNGGVGGGSFVNLHNSSKIRGYRFTGAAGTATKITAYTEFGAASHERRCGIYKQSDNNLLTNGGTNENTGTNGPAWEDFTFGTNPTITAVDYFLTIHANDVAKSTENIHYDVGTADYGGVDEIAYNGVLGSVTWDSTNNYKLSIYCTYDESGPSGPAGVKTIDGTAIASVKTLCGLAIASVKTINDSAA